jgi:hypothetical protein
VSGLRDTLAARLTRGRLAALALALVTAVTLVSVVAAARGWWRGDGGAYAPAVPLVRASVTPQSSLFGDVVTARVAVLVDGRRVDPRRVSLRPNFAPYRIRSESRRVERGIGRATLVELTYAIQCITRPCVALTAVRGTRSREAPPVRLEPARLTIGTRSRLVAWPPFVVHSRLSTEDVAESTPRVARFAPTDVSWAISPDALGALALSAAVLLGLGAAALVGSVLLRDGRRLGVRGIPGHLTPIQRALALAEHAAAAGEADEGRKALERLALELGRAGERELAGDARELAWSERDPSPELVGELANAVRSNGAR